MKTMKDFRRAMMTIVLSVTCLATNAMLDTTTVVNNGLKEVGTNKPQNAQVPQLTQGGALELYFTSWFMLSHEESQTLTKDEYEVVRKTTPALQPFTYEVYTAGRQNSIDELRHRMEIALKEMNGEIRSQVESLVNRYGKILPRDKKFEMEIKYQGNTWKFTKRPNSGGIRIEH